MDRTELVHKRDDPRQGGEEARVVMHQPRGVGLMHARHKPSDAHYTHADAVRRKRNTKLKTRFFL